MRRSSGWMRTSIGYRKRHIWGLCANRESGEDVLGKGGRNAIYLFIMEGRMGRPSRQGIYHRLLVASLLSKNFPVFIPGGIFQHAYLSILKPPAVDFMLPSVERTSKVLSISLKFLALKVGYPLKNSALTFSAKANPFPVLS
eukprot:IDg17501t1